MSERFNILPKSTAIRSKTVLASASVSICLLPVRVIAVALLIICATMRMIIVMTTTDTSNSTRVNARQVLRSTVLVGGFLKAISDR